MVHFSSYSAARHRPETDESTRTPTCRGPEELQQGKHELLGFALLGMTLSSLFFLFMGHIDRFKRSNHVET